MAPRPCLVCGTPSEGSRCRVHQLRPQPRTTHRPYDRLHNRLKKITVERWVARYGWVCPGYRCPPHPVRPGGLEGEHIIPRSVRPDLARELGNYSVLCRVCNARQSDRIA